MFAEGLGYVTPKAIPVLLNEEDTRGVRKYAESLSILKGYAFENCFVGLSGEAALGKHILKETGITRTVNYELYNNQGDGGIDMNIAGITLQIKTRRKGQANRVKRYTTDFIPLESQFYVFCQIIREGFNYLQVNLLGWISEAELQEQGRLRKHNNDFFIELDSIYLYPISRLMTRLDNENYKGQQ